MIEFDETEATQVIDLACRLQQIPSPTYHERAKAEFCFNHLSNHIVCDLHIDSVGNVICRLPGNSKKPSLVLSAHMDTVFPLDFALNLEKTESQICGPGIGDNSLGLAALLTLPRLVQSGHTHPGDIVLAATVCEEGLGNLLGIQQVAHDIGDSALAYISLEGMGLGNIIHRGLGVERYKVTVQTKGGHSWVDFGAPSAIHVLAQIVQQMTKIRLPKKPRTSINVGTFHGGTSVNTIAAKATCEIDFRSEHPRPLQDLIEKARKIASEFHGKNVAVEMERIGWRPAGEISANHPLVLQAAHVIGQLQLNPRLEIASTEANLPLSRGFPAITLGLTHGDRAHTNQEFIYTGPVLKGLQQVLDLISQIWDVNQ